MNVFTIHEAKTNLSKLIKLVEAGEEVAIARGNVTVVRLVPEKKTAAKSRGIGALKHLNLQVPDSVFFDPLSEEELAAWEGKYSFDP
jgi:antitoxin (DNA-binding transcriptional repressor) of toxin-antitoxin stability system